MASRVSVLRTARKPSERVSADIAELLGHLRPGHREGHYYVALFGFRRYDAMYVVNQIRKGLSFAAFERFQRNSELPVKALADAAEIPERTLARRKESGRFSADETDRLVRAARVVAGAIELFEGDTASASRWLTSPAAALGVPPLEMSSTGVGAIEVESLIGRLIHGIPT